VTLHACSGTISLADQYRARCSPHDDEHIAAKRMLCYFRYDQYADAWDTSVTRNIDGQEVRYFHTKKNGVDRVWIDNDAFLAKVSLFQGMHIISVSICAHKYSADTELCTSPQVWGKTGGKLYGQRSGSDYSDNQKRFVLFNKAAIEALTALPFSPGEDCVVVANDWHTAMFPVLLKVCAQSSCQQCAFQPKPAMHTISEQSLPPPCVYLLMFAVIAGSVSAQWAIQQDKGGLLCTQHCVSGEIVRRLLMSSAASHAACADDNGSAPQSC